MGDADGVWIRRTDDQLLAAAAALADFTEEGERLIREELRRRRLPEPPAPVGACPRCHRSIGPNHPSNVCVQCGEVLPLDLSHSLMSRGAAGERAGLGASGSGPEGLQALYEGTATLLSQGRSRADVQADLQLRGVDGETAGEVIRDLHEARQEAARTNVRHGGYWLVGGVLVTALTYLVASPGESYVVAWGAMLFGGIQFLRGLGGIRAGE